LRGLTIDRARLGDVAEPQEARDRVVIDRWMPLGHGAERLELRSKQQAVGRSGVVEWLNAETVAREHERTRRAIPQRKREHPDGPLDRPFHTPKRASFE